MKDFIELGKQSVVQNYNATHDIKSTLDDVFVVWSCKTLQNKKAILSGRIKGFPLYEFTWNGDKSEGYLDCYVKESNTVIK